MVVQTLLPSLVLAIPGAFGQLALYGPVTNRPHAGDPAPAATFTKRRVPLPATPGVRPISPGN